MQDSENSNPPITDSQEPLPEPSRPNDIFGGAGIREIQATYEMIVASKKAINQNDNWRGEDLQAMAMLMAMLSQMEVQYRAKLENLRSEEKEALRRAREEIRKAGGQVNGDTSSVPANPTV